MNKIGGGLGEGSTQKKTCDHLLISATIEASNSKFSTQLGFAEYGTRNNLRRTKIGGGLG